MKVLRIVNYTLGALSGIFLLTLIVLGSSRSKNNITEASNLEGSSYREAFKFYLDTFSKSYTSPTEEQFRYQTFT